ncbi:formyltransferase family protein [Alkalihalobacterium alkalinitrilicum]|uniref:formyltransferase family protein n=1 Tax=Alkalihalobacterium alkalinitrilicum TaxID=427920 RepID=UPI0009958243|nr:formyltransferase family protein [Alkalihalobacterium alkalinitrilicum]
MNDKKLRIILMGKKIWAAKALNYLISSGHEIVAVVARNPSEELDCKNNKSLFEVAQENNIPTLSITELYEWIEFPEKSLIDLNEIDLVISYLYWAKIKKSLLEVPKIGAINFHPAPLPDLKGLGGYNKAILEGRCNYGVTAHFMNENIDDGEIIEIENFPIDRDKETALSLEKKSQIHMFSLFKRAMNLIETNTPITRIKQKENEGLYINREAFEAMKYIKDDDTPEIIDRKIRAFWYPPYEGVKTVIKGEGYTVVNNEILKSISHLMHN